MVLQSFSVCSIFWFLRLHFFSLFSFLFSFWQISQMCFTNFAKLFVYFLFPLGLRSLLLKWFIAYFRFKCIFYYADKKNLQCITHAFISIYIYIYIIFMYMHMYLYMYVFLFFSIFINITFLHYNQLVNQVKRQAHICAIYDQYTHTHTI